MDLGWPDSDPPKNPKVSLGGSGGLLPSVEQATNAPYAVTGVPKEADAVSNEAREISAIAAFGAGKLIVFEN